MAGGVTFVVATVLLGLVAARLHNLKEGERCYTKTDEPGFCMKARRCPGIISRVRHGMKLKMCSYGYSGPIICCSSKALIERARSKCTHYGDYVFLKTILPTLTLHSEVYLQPRCFIIGSELIFGGEKASLKEFPHMGALGFGESEDNIDWVCGGSLISELFILTAAHCAYRGSESVGWVRLGDLSLGTDDDQAQPLTLRVVRIMIYPEYQPPSKYHDIALLQLESRPKLNEWVRPACLHTQFDLSGVVNATASGWGLTEKSGFSTSNDLMKVTLSFEDFEKCKKSFGRTNFKLDLGIQNDSMICAGDPEAGKDTCMGDSGGPLQIRLKDPFCMYSIVGVTSFGDEECGASTAVYTRVSNYVPWIVSIVWP